MKVSLPNYENIDLDREVWKTLVTISTIQRELKIEKISPQFIMAIRILEIPYPPKDDLRPIDSELIRLVEKTIIDHINILKSNGIIEVNEYVSIPSKHDALIGFLQNHLYLTIPFPLQSFYIFERILPQGKSKNAISSNEDYSFISLCRGFGYFVRGLFVKIRIGNFVFSGIIKFDDDLSNAYDYLEGIRNDLNKVGIIVDVLEKIPIKPISLFPLFTTGSEIYNSLYKNKNGSPSKIDNLESYLQNWFSGYLQAYHEITKCVPRMTLVDPHHEKPLHIIVSVDKNQNGISVIHLLSEDADKVDVNVVDKIPDMETIFKTDYLQSGSRILHASQTWSSNIVQKLGHPYMESMKDIAKRIEEFNKKARSPLFDVNDITDEKIIGWVKEELETKRCLIKRLGIEDPHWKRWLQPISVIIDYSLDEPKPNWRRSGQIWEYYIISDSDKIEIKKMDYMKIVEEATSKSPAQAKYLLISTGDLLHYMMEVMGEHSKSYF